MDLRKEIAQSKDSLLAGLDQNKLLNVDSGIFLSHFLNQLLFSDSEWLKLRLSCCINKLIKWLTEHV